MGRLPFPLTTAKLSLFAHLSRSRELFIDTRPSEADVRAFDRQMEAVQDLVINGRPAEEPAGATEDIVNRADDHMADVLGNAARSLGIDEGARHDRRYGVPVFESGPITEAARAGNEAAGLVLAAPDSARAAAGPLWPTDPELQLLANRIGVLENRHAELVKKVAKVEDREMLRAGRRFDTVMVDGRPKNHCRHCGLVGQNSDYVCGSECTPAEAPL